MDRRAFTAFALASVVAPPARAQSAEILDQSGRPLDLLPIPIEVQEKVQSAPGLVRVGATTPIVRIVEFFDFNCPFCKTAAPDLERILQENEDVQVVFLHNPILSPASREAAKLALAFWTLRGAEAAHRLAIALLARRGTIDGARAMAEAANLGVETDELRARVADPRIETALAIHERLAGDCGFSGTPAFEIKGQGFNGYPGEAALRRMIALVRSCDALAC